MGGPLKVAAMAAVIALQAIGCFASDAPTPVPTATPDIGAMVRAAIASALDGTPRPVPILPATPTSRPTDTPFPTPTFRPTNTPIIATLVPTPAPILDRLPTAECNPPNCQWHDKPRWERVAWQSGPRVTSSGALSLVARVDNQVKFVVPGYEGRDNITLTDDSHNLLGSIVPPSGPGWDWTPVPSLWIASDYRFHNRTLTVRAQIDPVAATHPGLRLCLWSGGSRSEQQLLSCVPVQQH